MLVSYFKWDFIAFKVGILSMKNRIVVTSSWRFLVHVKSCFIPLFDGVSLSVFRRTSTL